MFFASDLNFVGDAKFGVSIKSESLQRCNNSGKTVVKLALNLVEFIIPTELVNKGMSVYGNTQYKLKPLPDNIIQALKGTCFTFDLLLKS